LFDSSGGRFLAVLWFFLPFPFLLERGFFFPRATNQSGFFIWGPPKFLFLPPIWGVLLRFFSLSAGRPGRTLFIVWMGWNLIIPKTQLHQRDQRVASILYPPFPTQGGSFFGPWGNFVQDPTDETRLLFFRDSLEFLVGQAPPFCCPPPV